MSLTPDELLDALGAALRPPPVEPGPAELAAFHRMIDERCVAPAVRRTAMKRAWARPFAVAAVAAGLVVGSGAAAFAAGAPVPRPIRAAAHDVGLPVDSPQLTDAKGAVSELRAGLAAGNTAVIKRVVARLHRELAKVPGDERDQVVPDAKVLLARADERLRTADATLPAAEHVPSKHGTSGARSGGSKSASGSTSSGSTITGSGGAGAGSAAIGASTGSGGAVTGSSSTGASTGSGGVVAAQPSVPVSSPVPASPPSPAPSPSVPTVAAPPVVAAPVVAPVVATPVVIAIATAPVVITVATAPDTTPPVVVAAVATVTDVTASPSVTPSLPA